MIVLTAQAHMVKVEILEDMVISIRMRETVHIIGDTEVKNTLFPFLCFQSTLIHLK